MEKFTNNIPIYPAITTLFTKLVAKENVVVQTGSSPATFQQIAQIASDAAKSNSGGVTIIYNCGNVTNQFTRPSDTACLTHALHYLEDSSAVLTTVCFLGSMYGFFLYLESLTFENNNQQTLSYQDPELLKLEILKRKRNRNLFGLICFRGVKNRNLGLTNKTSCDNIYFNPGAQGAEETRQSIPNLAVKLCCGDNTAGGALWEDSSVPGPILYM